MGAGARAGFSGPQEKQQETGRETDTEGGRAHRVLEHNQPPGLPSAARRARTQL